jgi:hypothetical protein
MPGSEIWVLQIAAQMADGAKDQQGNRAACMIESVPQDDALGYTIYALRAIAVEQWKGHFCNDPQLGQCASPLPNGYPQGTTSSMCHGYAALVLFFFRLCNLTTK